MAEKTINTRILLKYDTYENWTTNNPVLKAGEVAIATVPTNQGGVQNAPAVLMKVGDVTSDYKTLKFVSGTAADVYGWAKEATKPTYAANEITGLADFISGEIQDTDTQYRITKVDDYNYKLQSKAKGTADTTFTDVSTIVIPKYDDTNVKADITALETLVGETAVATQITNAIAALKLADTYEAKGEAAKVQTALNSYKTTNDTAVQAAKSAADAAQSDVDALEEKVGTVTAGKTVVQMIEDAKTAATYDDTALKNRVTTLEGDDAGKSARAIAAEETAKIVAGADTSYDTLKEIADWISSHKTDATAMNSAIVKLEAILDGIGGEGEKATVVAYVTDAISALKIGDYAKAADLTALAGRVSTLETTITAKANDADLAAIAKSGNVNDLVQTSGDVLIFDCGSSAF